MRLEIKLAWKFVCIGRWDTLGWGVFILRAREGSANKELGKIPNDLSRSKQGK